MKVLSIGTDRKLFEESSAVLSRSLEYARKMEELHIVVFSLKNLGLKEVHKGNLHIYPTNSLFKILYFWDAIGVGERIIKNNKFDKNNSVITTQDPFETGKVGNILKKIYGIPLQIQIHTDFLSPYFKSLILNRIRVVLAKSLIPKADGLRVVSSVIEDSIKKTFPNIKAQVSVLPIFVDMEKIENIVATKDQVSHSTFKIEKNIFMASRLTKEKRFDIAIKAFKKVTEKVSDVGLVISGLGPERNNIEKIVGNFGLNEKVKFMGWENNDDMAFFFAKSSDIFLLTSEFEGYGMTLIEAGVSGCPIVTTKVGIAKTDLFKNGENSFVCPVGDMDCLAKSIIDLITNEEKRKSFSLSMRDSIKKIAISREDYVASYVGLLNKLVKNV